MNAFEQLLDLPAEQKALRGLEHTPREIAQQPETWSRAAGILRRDGGRIRAFLQGAGMRGAGRAALMLAGAGSSEFVGSAAAPALRKRLKRPVASISTTDFVTHPEVFVPDQDYVVLSFARSGNSPESMATYDLVRQVCPRARQIAITCNPEGALAKAAGSDAGSLYIELPEETNDRSLVMTSSFTTMAFTAMGLGLLDEPEDLESIAEKAGEAGRRVISAYADVLKRFADQPFTRACFLGSSGLKGVMQECHLKMQEMTEGRVAAMFNSFVGLRHGPQVFVDRTCAVIAALASDRYVRQYELDMLAELKQKEQGCGTLVICDRATPQIRELASEVIELFPVGESLEDDFRVMTDAVVGQLLGTFACLRCGLKPDNPSVSGTINRVVEAVKIYPRERGRGS